MGCLNSKLSEEPVASGAAAATSDGTQQKSTKSTPFRDPSMALQKVLGAVGEAVKGTSKAVGETAQGTAHHVRNVFATPLDQAAFEGYKPPVHEKTAKETSFIQESLQSNFVFENLTDKELSPLVKAFETTTVAAGKLIIEQGDDGDYFYIVKRGHCAFVVDGKKVGQAGRGASFGELALLYTCPRAATVKAVEDVQLYRVDQTTFRFILQNQTVQGEKNKGALLQGVDFLKELDPVELSKLAAVMTPKPFSEGDYLIRKGDAADYFYIVQEGTVMVTDIGVGDTAYEDLTLKAGDYVGERALVTGDPRAANAVAKTDGMAFCIDKATFDAVLGELSVLILRAQDNTKLSGIKIIKDTRLDARTLASLAKLIEDKTFKAGDKICEQGELTEAAVYLIREGNVNISDKSGSRKDTIESGGYFGDEQLLADVSAGKNQTGDPTTVLADYTATIKEDCTCGVLTLAKCRTIIDTLTIGKGKANRFDSIAGQKITLDSLKRHRILGAGTFGQVWLVSRKAADGSERAYALKIQSKYELAQDGQAKAVVDEKNIMSQLQHPFISELVVAFQDPAYVYMLMGLVQGGELYSVIHTETKDGVKEAQARFYAAGIAEGLAFMHRRGFVYRDLKPENVMLDSQGYPVIVDFGFAKYLTDKTYTLCGTPLYIPPEVILNRGHSWSADHWSLGVLTYEMLTGFTPFYTDGMEQMDLFRAIVKGQFTMPRVIHKDAGSLIKGFLTKDPAKRLGSLAGGEDGVYDHPWFKTIDFADLRSKRTKAPFTPKISDPLDASNFENWSHLADKMKENYPKLTAKDAKLFEAF